MHGPNCKVGSYCTVGRRLQEVNVLGGLVLPIWNAIEKALSKQVTWDHIGSFNSLLNPLLVNEICIIMQ